MPVRILIAADRDNVRVGLRMLCDTHRDWEICGEAADGQSAIKEALNTAPHLIVLDLRLIGLMNACYVATQIQRIAPLTNIIVLSDHQFSPQDAPVTGRKTGACTVVSKFSGMAELVATIDCLTASLHNQHTSWSQAVPAHWLN